MKPLKRGQAWGIYGFAMCYMETGFDRYREVAQSLAAFYWTHLPENKVPFWDFDAPNIPNEPNNASSAAIVADGLLILAEADQQNLFSQEQVARAELLLQAIWENCRAAETLSSARNG